jgi:hypothetical protein
MLDALASSMVRRLKAQMPVWTVEDFPNAPERYNFCHQTSTLLVAFEGSTYSDPYALSPMAADREVEMSVTVLARQLRGNLSITGAFELIRKALFGWRPTTEDDKPIGFGAMRPTRESFVGEEQGVWRYVVVYRSALPTVAAISTTTSAALKSVGLKGTGE